jgi:hypothetical protein
MSSEDQSWSLGFWIWDLETSDPALPELTLKSGILLNLTLFDFERPDIHAITPQRTSKNMILHRTITIHLQPGVDWRRAGLMCRRGVESASFSMPENYPGPTRASHMF